MSGAATREAGSGDDRRALAGRVVLVTGAHGGLGSAAAVACARAGAIIILLGRRPAKLNRVYDNVSVAGAEPLLYPFDLEGASPDDHLALAARIDQELGRLDGVLHCAAEFRGLTPLEQTDPAALARAIHVDLTAAVWMSQACLPLLRRAADAALVFTLDDPVRYANAFWGGYGLAQHALAGLVPMWHAELANTPVRISGIRPGPMRTSLRARAFVEEDDRIARDPSAYADACVELLSPAGATHRGRIHVPEPR